MWDILAHWNILCRGYCIFPQSKLSFNFLPFSNKKTINVLKEVIKHLFQNMTEAGRADMVTCPHFHSKYKWKHECLFLSLQTKASNWPHLGDRLNKGPLCCDEICNCLELARSSGVGISVPRALAGMPVSAYSCSCICLV